MKSDDNTESNNGDDANSSSGNGSAPGSATNEDSSTTSRFTQSNGRGSEIPEDIVASKETRAVKWSRLTVLVVLLISAIISGAMTWYWSRQSEKNHFETQVY